jgi:hypothetical protein
VLMRERERKAASSRGMSMRCRTHGLSNYSSIVISHDASKTSIPSPLPNYTFPSLCTSITTIMAGIRPPVLDAAFRSCTRARRAPALRNTPFSNRSPAVQRRWIGDMNGRPPVPPGGGAGKTTVLAPKTRLAVGVVFIGALIYSMVKNISPTKSRTATADHPPSKGHRRCGTAA